MTVLFPHGHPAFITYTLMRRRRRSEEEEEEVVVLGIVKCVYVCVCVGGQVWICKCLFVCVCVRE